MPSPEPDRKETPPQWEQLERKESELWRDDIILLLILAGALAVSSWRTLRTLPHQLGAVPVGIVVLVALFGVYVWRKRREISELRSFVRGLQQNTSAPPTEKQLKQLLDLVTRSRHGYRELIDSLDHIVFTMSLRGEIQLVNRRFVELLSVSFTEVVHHNLDEFISEPTPEDAERELERFRERRFWSGVVRLRLKKNAEVRYLNCTLHAVVKGEQVIGVSGLALDVTAQRASEARFTELFATLQEGVYFSTPDGKLLEVNPSYTRMLGYDSADEVLAVNSKDLFLDLAERRQLIAEIEERGVIRDREITLKRKDGTPVRCLDSAIAVRDSSGRVVRYQGTLVDITQRIEMEKRLHQEQEFVRRLVDSLPDAIMVLDREGRYTFVSPRIRELSGFSPEELMQSKLGDRIDPKDFPAVQEQFQKLIMGECATAQAEYRTIQKNGNWRIFRANASPLYDDMGKITGVVASARDVTEAKKLEHQLLQSEKLVAMGQMIAGVAHEINNPLTAILGVSDLLHEAAKDDRTRRQTELIHQQARRAAQIVQSLLSFSRPPTATRASAQLEQVVQRALQLHGHSLLQNHIAVDLVPPPELPAIEADANQLLQVFLNLLANAEQAIREVRDQGRIRIEFGHSGPRVWAVIEDDGPGVKPDVVARIFDPFFTTKRPGGGTGLGLTICLSLIKEHGGTIEFQPGSAGGAAFRVILPVAGQANAPLLQTTPAASAALHGHSVLLVEDEPAIRELVQDGLSARGLTVACVGSSEEALSHLVTHSYDAIICDYNLPGLTGEQLFDKLRGGTGGSAKGFIFITGELFEQKFADSFAARGARVLRKPFQLSELAALLSEIFEVIPVESR